MDDEDGELVMLGDVGQGAVFAAERLERALVECLEGSSGTIETGVRLDLAVAALRDAAEAADFEARRLVAFPYGAMTSALANLRGYPKLGAKRGALAGALEEGLARLAPFMSLPPPLPRASAAPENQRRSPRIPLRVPVLYYGPDRSCTGTATDISEGGLFIETDELFPVGSELHAFLVLPPCDEVRVDAVVRWIRDKLDSWIGERRPSQGMGAQFTALDDSVAETVRRFVARKAAEAARVTRPGGPRG